MRERVNSIGSVGFGGSDRYVVERPASRASSLRFLGWRLRNWFMLAVGVSVVGAIYVNALFLQTGQHPAPIFANRLSPPAIRDNHAMIVPRSRPSEFRSEQKTELPMPARTRTEVIAEIQRELVARGFYNGPADGIHNAKTDIAIRDFEHTASLPPSLEPNDTLRRAIIRSNIKAVSALSGSDQSNSANAASKRVIAFQRALADYGYGQLRPTGQYDPQTRDAIERFERNRKLPVTGRISDRVIRELALVTGRPLE